MLRAIPEVLIPLERFVSVTITNCVPVKKRRDMLFDKRLCLTRLRPPMTLSVASVPSQNAGVGRLNQDSIGESTPCYEVSCHHRQCHIRAPRVSPSKHSGWRTL